MKKLMGTVQIGSPVGTMKVSKPDHTAEAPYDSSIYGETASGNLFDLSPSPSESISAAPSPGSAVPFSLVPKHIGDDRNLWLAARCDIQGFRSHSLAMRSGCYSPGRISSAPCPSSEAQKNICIDQKPRSRNTGDGRQHSGDPRKSGRNHRQLLQRRSRRGNFGYQPSGLDGCYWRWEGEHHSRRSNRSPQADWPWSATAEENGLVHRTNRNLGVSLAQRRADVGRMHRLGRFCIRNAMGKRGTFPNPCSSGF